MEGRREEAEQINTWVQDSLMGNLKEEPDLEVTTAKMTFYEHESIANSNYYGANYAGHRNMNQQQQQFYPKHQNYGNVAYEDDDAKYCNIAYDNTAAYNNHSPSYQSNRGGDEYRHHHQQQYSAQTNDTVFLTAEGSPHVSDHSMRWQRRDKEHHHHHNHQQQQQQQETTLANNINHMGACTGEAYYHSTTYPHSHQQEGSNEAFLYAHPQQHYVEEKDRSRGSRPPFSSESYHHDDISFVLDDSLWNDLEPIAGHPPMHAFNSYATSPEAAVTARTYSQGVSIHGSEAERKVMLKRSISEPHVSSAAANFSQKRSRKLEIQVDLSIPSPNATITTADARISGARPVRPIVRRKSSPRTRALDSFSEFAQMANARVQLSQDQIDRFFEVVYTLRNIDQGFEEELDQRLKRTFTWNENAALLLCSFLQEGDRTPFKGILQQFNRALVDQVQDAKTSPHEKSLLKDLRPIRDRSSLRKRLQKLLGSEQLTRYWANTRRVAAAYFVHMVVQACRENETAAQGAQHEYEDDATTSTINTDAHYSPRSEVSYNTARPQKAEHDLPVQKPYLNPGLVAELEEISTLMRNCYEDLDLYMPPDSAEPKTPLGKRLR